MEPLDLTPDMLLRAYTIGVFPMAEDHNDPDLFWIDPRMRGILPMDGFHVPRSLRKVIRKGKFHITFDHAFEEVMEGCAESTEKRPRTWINDKIHNLYTSLYHKGHAHSVEIWYRGELVGGLYGVSLGSAFFGESMFSRTTDASKVALVHLMARIQFAGYTLLDTQFVTQHLEKFGAIEIPRSEYRTMLSHAMAGDANFHDHHKADEILTYLKQLQTS